MKLYDWVNIIIAMINTFVGCYLMYAGYPVAGLMTILGFISGYCLAMYVGRNIAHQVIDNFIIRTLKDKK